MYETILANKAILVGIHLGLGIIGIDALIWLLGELVANQWGHWRTRLAATVSVLAFVGSWVVGGYYYVKFYGPLVKPVINASSAPWAHKVVMEAKEHIFLFLVPMVMTILLVSLLNSQEVFNLKRPYKMLVFTTGSLSLLIGLMGFIISASARWA